ncbi:MAG: YbaN family protein [Saccharofermentanales bacterium]
MALDNIRYDQSDSRSNGYISACSADNTFLLLAAFCYARSSRKLHDWLISRKHLGSYIHNYMEHRAIKKSVKVRAVIFLWVALILSMILVDNLYVRIILPLIGAAVTWHIASLKTIE